MKFPEELAQAIKTRNLKTLDLLVNLARDRGLRYREIFSLAQEGNPNLTSADFDALMEELDG